MHASAILLASLISLTPSDRIPKDLREHIKQRIEQGYGVGIIVGVIDAEGVEYFSHGAMSPSGGTIDEHTLFEIGSITKVFTGILLADAVARGEAAFGDPVRNYLPAGAVVPSRGGKEITLRELVTHRSGLPRMPDNFDPKDQDDPYADYTGALMLDFLAKHELQRDIGSQYEYSNLGAGLLGYALAQRAGTIYEKLITERVLQPLGMKETAITLTEAQKGRLAVGHSAGKPVKNWHLDALAGAGALRSTAADMLRFLSANMGLMETPLLTTLQGAYLERNETTEKDLFVAFGWHIWNRHGTTIVWHNGGTGGYRSWCGFVPERQTGVVVLTNSDDDSDDVGLHLLERKWELKTLRQMVKVEAKDLVELNGYYELAPGTILHVTSENDQLYVQLTGQDRFPVFPESKEKFFWKIVDAQLTFVRGADGKVDHVVLHQNGDRQAKRLVDYKPAERKEVRVDPSILAEYVGQYQFAPGAIFDITLEGDQLKAKLGNQPTFPVFPESETKFFYKVVEAQLTFVRDDTGEVSSLILHQGGKDQRARRVPKPHP